MFLPSVVGVGEASLPSSLRMMPRPAVPIFFVQISLPSVLRQMSTTVGPSPLRTKRRSPQTIGVAPPMPGNFSDQRTFLFSSQVVGRPISLEMPLRSGPRQEGQFSAWEIDTVRNNTISEAGVRSDFTSEFL